VSRLAVRVPYCLLDLGSVLSPLFVRISLSAHASQVRSITDQHYYSLVNVVFLVLVLISVYRARSPWDGSPRSSWTLPAGFFQVEIAFRWGGGGQRRDETDGRASTGATTAAE
jgi:hypothetical protein